MANNINNIILVDESSISTVNNANANKSESTNNTLDTIVPLQIPALQKQKLKKKHKKKPKIITARQFYEFPVYRDLRMLIIQMQLSSQTARRFLKNGKILQSQNKVIEIMQLTAFEDKNNDAIDIDTKIRCLIKSIRLLEQVRLCNRVIYDLQGYRKKGFAKILLKEEQIYRQLNGWYNYFLKIKNQNTNQSI